jgi:hypothetical protein
MIKYRWINVERGQDGEERVYFRRYRNEPRIRLPPLDAKNFASCYRAALAGEAAYRPARRNKNDVVRRDSGSSLVRGLRSAKVRAGVRGLPYDLDWEWAERQLERQRFRCPMTGLKFFMDRSDEGTKNPFSPSIDRIEPRLGYTKTNCRIIIFAMNAMLSDWGENVVQLVMEGYQTKQGENKRCPQLGSACPQPKNQEAIS